MQSLVLPSESERSKVAPCQSDAHPALDQAPRHRPQSERSSHFFHPNLARRQSETCACIPAFARPACQRTDKRAAADYLSESTQRARVVARGAYREWLIVDYPREPFLLQQESRLPEREAGGRHDVLRNL